VVRSFVDAQNGSLLQEYVETEIGAHGVRPVFSTMLDKHHLTGATIVVDAEDPAAIQALRERSVSFVAVR
jgi:hypothetical protein